MRRIESLTKEQIGLFPEYIKKWTAIGLSTDPADRKRAENGIRLAYQIGGIKPPKLIVWCGSPLSNALTKLIVQKISKNKASVVDSVGDSVWASVGDSVWASVRASLWASVVDSVRDSVGASVWDSVVDSVVDSVGASVGASVRASVGDSVWASVVDSVVDSVGDSVGASVRASVRASVVDSVGDSVWASVVDSVRASVRASVVDSVGDSVGASGYGQHDANWIGFYHFFREVLDLKTETDKIVGLSEICQSAGWYLPHENICWISERHNLVRKDPQGRLHFDGGPAIAYPDGWEIYAWHGVRIPENMGSIRSEQWKPEWLLKEKNSERRRVLIQGLGYGRIVKALNAKTVDSWREYQLVKISESVDVEPLLLLSMKCPSTGLIHCHRVPPDMDTARNAIRWVNHGVDAEEFVCET